jgi:hypothetical protein
MVGGANRFFLSLSMDQSEIINTYTFNIRMALNKMDISSLDEIEISKVINAEYEKMRLHFDKHIISKLSEDEIEEFFETLDSKTNNLIDSISQQ